MDPDRVFDGTGRLRHRFGRRARIHAARLLHSFPARRAAAPAVPPPAPGAAPARQEKAARLPHHRARLPARQQTPQPPGRVAEQFRQPSARSPASTVSTVSSAAAPSRAIRPAFPAKARAASSPEPAKVAWNTPPIMVVGQTEQIELRIGFDPARFKDIEARIKASGHTTSEEVELARNLTAKLTSSQAFHIDRPEPRQEIARDGRDAVWVWLITPNTAGKEKLLLTITSNYGDGPTSEQLVRSIDVMARDKETSRQILDFVLKNWEKLLTIVVIPIGVLGWKSWHKGRPG
jgi:hypothetical protein